MTSRQLDGETHSSSSSSLPSSGNSTSSSSSCFRLRVDIARIEGGLKRELERYDIGRAATDSRRLRNVGAWDSRRAGIGRLGMGWQAGAWALRSIVIGPSAGGLAEIIRSSSAWQCRAKFGLRFQPRHVAKASTETGLHIRDVCRSWHCDALTCPERHCMCVQDYSAAFGCSCIQ